MRKKTIGIFYNSPFNEESFVTGCGGSDTWVIQIAKEFLRKGYHVIVFSLCDEWHFSHCGVEYVPCRMLLSRLSYQQFDHFIMTRMVNKEIYDAVVENGCHDIYLQSHDMFVWEDNMYERKFIYDEEKYPYIRKYIALTEYHKWELHEYNRIPYDRIEIIGNGLDSEVFDEIYENNPFPEKDNSILFPTVYSRGGDILVNGIMPLVKERIPDFRVRLCGYSQNFPENVRNNPDVDILGMLDKHQYYREFMKHKVWFLPCTVPEDFGLCAGEAVMCGCDVVSPFLHGMEDVCGPFTVLKMENRFKVIDTEGGYHYSEYRLNMSREDYARTCQEAADRIADSIENYERHDRELMRAAFRKYIVGRHSWDNVTGTWIGMFGKGSF